MWRGTWLQVTVFVRIVYRVAHRLRIFQNILTTSININNGKIRKQSKPTVNRYLSDELGA
jgi:hypothetical protein